MHISLGWLMGIGKREAVYPKPLLEIMTRNLIGVYQSVFPMLDNMHESCIFEIFGCTQSSIEFKWYNIGGKDFDEKEVLDLDTILGANATTQEVREFLSRRGVRNDIISWFTREMEGADTLSKIMGRIRNCRGSHMNHVSAKALDEKDVLDLDTRLGANATVQEVRAFLSRRGVSHDIISWFTKEMEGGSTLSTIMGRIRKFRAAHRLQHIAFLLPKGVSSLDGLSGELKCMINAISLTLEQPQELVFQRMLKHAEKHAEKSTCQSLRHQLAKLLNDACCDDDDDDGVNALENHEDFKRYCKFSGLDSAAVMQKVKDTAMSYNETFWRNYRALVLYKEKHRNDVITIEGKDILTVDGNNHGLYRWLCCMNGYTKSIGSKEGYGFIAYLRPGSVEYNALSRLGVSFDARLNKAAMNARTVAVLDRMDTSGKISDNMSLLW